LRWSRSQMTESASRWLVGSSSSRVCASEKQDAGQFDAPGAGRRNSVCSGCWSTRSGSPSEAAMDARLGLGRVPAEDGEGDRTGSRSGGWPSPPWPGSGSDISASALRIWSRSSSRPARRQDAVKREERPGSPVLGSCGEVADGTRVPDGAGGRQARCRKGPWRGWSYPRPFRPTRPMRSPCATWKDASASRSRAPARSSMPLATIMITKNTGSRRRLSYRPGDDPPLPPIKAR